MTVTAGRRVDWKDERERIDLAAVATNLLGPAPGRRGERGGRLWWSCPLGSHEDRNPSFCVDPGKWWWKCWGCGASGDAAALVMRVRAMTFPEAVAFLTGGPAPSGRGTKPGTLRGSGILSRPQSGPPAPPSGLPEADASALVTGAAARLWAPEGAAALAYLTGRPRPDAPAFLEGRCLNPETIRAARLGWTPGVQVRAKDGRPYAARGVVIPWFRGPRLALVKVRQPEGAKPKYAEVFRDPAALPAIYPGPEAVRPGRPLVVVEGEFDALSLGEALGGLVGVVTLGSASARPDLRSLGVMLAAPRWFVATDRDEAGDKAAAGWPARARRARPPEPFKDWTEAKAAGVDLARWWRDVLAGVARPPLFTWDELSRWRWGPDAEDLTPGIDNPGRRPTLESLESLIRQGVEG
jgi:hypothetical protein